MMIKTWLPKRYFHILLDMILALGQDIFQGNIIIINIIYNTQSSKTIQYKYHGQR